MSRHDGINLPRKGCALDDRRVERRLAAILAADVVGYSRLMGADEVGTLTALKAHRRELIDPKIAEHHGRIVKTTGDGLLVEFASVVDAVRCALEVNHGMGIRNADSRRTSASSFASASMSVTSSSMKTTSMGMASMSRPVSKASPIRAASACRNLPPIRFVTSSTSPFKTWVRWS